MEEKKLDELTHIDDAVLEYLEKFKATILDDYSRLAIFGVSARDMVKYLKDKTIAIKWGEEFTAKMRRAVDKTYEKYIIDFPEIPPKNRVDIFIAKMFKKNNTMALGTNAFFTELVNINHMIAYLNRDKVIYSWNPYFILLLQHEHKRMLAHLTGD